MSKIAELAFGRVLRMAARPEQEGDVTEYERCRRIIMDEMGGYQTAATVERPPLPGWNFGSGATGCVE